METEKEQMWIKSAFELDIEREEKEEHETKRRLGLE